MKRTWERPGSVYPGSFYMQGNVARIMYRNAGGPPWRLGADVVLSVFFLFFLISAIVPPPEDWSSSGYSAMLGSSPHIGQPGSFSSINPQDRMVSGTPGSQSRSDPSVFLCPARRQVNTPQGFRCTAETNEICPVTVSAVFFGQVIVAMFLRDILPF